MVGPVNPAKNTPSYDPLPRIKNQGNSPRSYQYRKGRHVVFWGGAGGLKRLSDNEGLILVLLVRVHGVPRNYWWVYISYGGGGGGGGLLGIRPYLLYVTVCSLARAGAEVKQTPWYNEAGTLARLRLRRIAMIVFKSSAG